MSLSALSLRHPCNACDCYGGGWSGTQQDGGKKGGVNDNALYFWVR